MNKALYTILVAAVSVGITLAFVAGCHKQCVCDAKDYGREQNNAAMQNSGYDGSGTEDAGNSGSHTSSKRRASGAAIGNGSGIDNSAADQPKHKYGDADKGGNVYTIGGVSPEPEPSGSVTNTSSSGTTNGGGSGSSVKPEKQKTGNSGNPKN